MRFKKRRFWLVILIFAVLIGFIVTYPLIFAWSPLCCRCQDVDIKSGRIRYSRYLFYCKISEKIEDTILTEELGEFAEDVQPDWHRVNTFSPGVRHSPHYAYHGAIGQLNKIAVTWQLFPFSDEAKRQVARTILNKWQADGNYFGVDDYIADVSRIAGRKTEFDSKAIILVTDLSSAGNE